MQAFIDFFMHSGVEYRSEKQMHHEVQHTIKMQYLLC